MIHTQGSPKGFDDGIHFGISPKDKEQGNPSKIGCFDNWDSLCNNANYHKFLTKDLSKVTCKECLKKVGDL